MVFIVSVEVPDPTMDAGLNPPLVIPVGKPDSLPTLRLTVLANPLCGVTVTVKRALCPGLTVTAEGLTSMEKSAVRGSTVTVRIGGEGSEFPLESITVSEGVNVPADAKVTFPGLRAVEVAGVPPGKTQEYAAAVALVENATEPPAWMVTSPAGASIEPDGGADVYGVICRNAAFEGTPAASSRNSR